MTKPSALADTSYLFDVYNYRKVDYAGLALSQSYIIIIPQVVLVEITYLLVDRGAPTLGDGVQVATAFLDKVLKAPIPTEPLVIADLERATAIMKQYANVPFDFVDCCIMALAERLNITTIFTKDQKDFRIFRPSHCEHFEILP
jgi:uncharacterized protein